MRYCILDASDIVTNVVEADPETVSSIFPDAVLWKAPAAIGSQYDRATDTFGAPPAPPSVRWCSPYEFLLRFTVSERVAIRASADPVVSDFLDLLNKIRGDLNLDDPNTVAGVNYMEQHGLIAAGRAAQILA